MKASAPLTSVVRANSIAGFADYTVPQHIEFCRWKQMVSGVFDLYGFVRFDSKKVERVEDLTKKGGLERDIFAITHYRGDALVDETGKASVLCLPFDRTVPLALVVAKDPSIRLPLKRQDVDYSWRCDQPSVGRFRAFIQADVDIIDRNLNILAESECISAILEALDSVGVNKYVMYLNHIAIVKSLVRTLGLAESDEPEALRIIDKLDKIEVDEAIDQLLALKPQVDGTAVADLLRIFAFRGSVTEFRERYTLPAVGQLLQQVSQLNSLLIAKGVAPEVIQFCPGMVRGLDYYTGIVFETYLTDAPHRGSIASGGRYDNLIEAVSDTPVTDKIQGFGGSIGLTRLFDVCLREGFIEPRLATAAKVLICFRKVHGEEESELQMCGASIAKNLRKRGISADLFTNPDTNVKKQLDYANSKGYPNVVVVMDKTAFVVKNMLEATQKEVHTTEDAVSIVENHLVIQMQVDPAAVESARLALERYQAAVNPSGREVQAPSAIKDARNLK